MKLPFQMRDSFSLIAVHIFGILLIYAFTQLIFARRLCRDCHFLGDFASRLCRLFLILLRFARRLCRLFLILLRFARRLCRFFLILLVLVWYFGIALGQEFVNIHLCQECKLGFLKEPGIKKQIEIAYKPKQLNLW